MYRAVNVAGHNFGFLLTVRRGAVVALRFFRKAICSSDASEVVSGDICSLMRIEQVSSTLNPVIFSK
ncbi:hypothetical protein ACUNEV_11410 [Serratia sp. IR-2025]|uniref:hypothetical protein n=1 Tax=Serratia fonticola TaxID=47917 RepID=UPI003B58A2CC